MRKIFSSAHQGKSSPALYKQTEYKIKVQLDADLWWYYTGTILMDFTLRSETVKRAPSELLAVYDAAYRANNDDIPAPIIGKKDSNLAKKLLARYSFEELSTWLRLFFLVPDPFIQGSGYTFGVFVACLGKVIQYDRRQSRPVAARPQPSQNLIEIRKRIDDEWRSR